MRSCELVGDRFKLVLPGWTPWKLGGKANLSYLGLESFVGDIEVDGDTVWFIVERVLPQLPNMLNRRLVLQSMEDLKQKFLSRLKAEVARREQPIPEMPEELPELTRLAKIRFARFGSSGPTVETRPEGWFSTLPLD